LSREEAERRAAQIGAVSYDLEIDLEAGAKTFRGEVTISFEYRGPGDTFVEWTGGQIDRLVLNGVAHEPRWDGRRIGLPGDRLRQDNELRISFERRYDRTGEGFHQFVDPEDGSEYLYTQFEPYSAHRLFPCFDQPDLKATYRVAVTAPADWAVVSAGAEIDREESADGRVRRVFAETPRFSTYLFSICAGPFASVHDEHRGIPLGLYCRASLIEHLDPDEIWAVTKAGIDYFSEFFDEPYPFGKYDQLFVPEFNWGGMENVAAVTYTDGVVFRDPPTEDQLVRRAEYLLHELAHMWFGDLVTLQWWSDLWLNESFASYVAYAALDHGGRYPAIWQDFHFRMKLWAYREDQLPTTHRIADDVPSTDETFLNFDGITYGKGAAVLKQLVAAIGEEAFREGMRLYFRRHRFGNATLADFLAALQEGAGIDLVHWAARWLRSPSLNTIAVDWTAAGGSVTGFELVQTAPAEHPTLRPHHLEAALIGGDDSVRVLPVTLEGPRQGLDAVVGSAAPAFVYPNHGDHGYAKVALDPASITWAKERLGSIGDPLLRQQVWASLWDMVRDRGLSSLEYLALVENHLGSEPSLPMVRMVTATVAGAIGRYVPEDAIEASADRFVAAARRAIDTAPPGDLRVTWARALIGLAATTPDAMRVAAGVVDSPPQGLAVDQDMRWAVAVALAALGDENADGRLAGERTRDPSDRGARAVERAAAARPSVDAKDRVWERLHHQGYESLHLALAAASGFWVRRQRGLLEPFVARFFEGLPTLFAEWEVEAARGYWRSFYPAYRIESSTGDHLRGLLARDDLGPVLRRVLTEAADDLDRALACRAVAAEVDRPSGTSG
jgi:aminopeptidase N